MVCHIYVVRGTQLKNMFFHIEQINILCIMRVNIFFTVNCINIIIYHRTILVPYFRDLGVTISCNAFMFAVVLCVYT